MAVMRYGGLTLSGRCATIGSHMRKACYIAMACVLLRGQGPANPRFEAASLKPDGPLAQGFPSRRIVGGPGTPGPGQITYTEQSLKDLLFIAYPVQLYQLTTPSWMEGEYFSIRAKVVAGATKDDVCLMLQDLLADRFKLRLHHESREVQGYVLTVGTKGPRIQVSPAVQAETTTKSTGGNSPSFGVDKDGFITVPPGYTNMMTLPARDGVVRLTASRATMDVLGGYLSRQLQRPVVNQTGLTGIYDFHLAFAPVDVMVSEPLGSPDGGNSSVVVARVPEPGTTLVRAIESQLGLRMEPKRVPVDVLVIDHVEKKPAED